NWHGLSGEFGNDSDWGNWWNNRYEFNDNFSQPVAEASSVKIISAEGDINITVSDDNQVHAVVHKVVRSDSQESANRLNESTRPKFIQQGTVSLLDLSSGDFDNIRVDLDLQVPRKMALSVAARRGNLSVSERDGNIELTTDHGDASASTVKGSALLHVHNGSVTVKDITGNVQIDGEVEDGNVSDVTGTVDFNAGYNGSVELSHITQQLHFKSVR